MNRIFNFSAGPAVLPQEVLEQAQGELVNWHGSGMSVMEMSHRGKEFMGIQAEAEANAANTYAAAYGKDPEFYDFYRAMESYRRTFEQGSGDSTMILSPDSEYLRQFRGQR